jgi:hypothetical protein
MPWYVEQAKESVLQQQKCSLKPALMLPYALEMKRL